VTSQRVVHVESLSSPEVTEFVAVARRVCDAIDQVEQSTELEFLRQMQELLPLVYSRAQKLQWPWDYEGEDDEDEEFVLEPEPEIALPCGGHLEWWKHLCDVIGRKLSWHRLFHFVYDPVDPKDREVIDADLADCLANIYIDLKIGLLHYDEGTIEHQSQAIWQWKFDAGAPGWANHVAEVLLPVHHLLHTHYSEDDEVFDI
jgi:Domain of unknown function (DUF5063)